MSISSDFLLVKLDVSLRKKLRYNCLTVNVFLYCFMDLKLVHLVSQICARLTSHLIYFFMKLFRTNNIETVKVCQFFFGISLPSVVLRSRTDKFEQKFSLTVLVLSGDVVKALAWVAIILPCCLCFSLIFLFMCYHYVWWIKLNIYLTTPKKCRNTILQNTRPSFQLCNGRPGVLKVVSI